MLSISGAPVSTERVLAGKDDTGGRRCGPATPSLSFCLPRVQRLRHLSPRARETISGRACRPVGALTALGFGASRRTGGDETWAVEVSSGRDAAALAGEVASVCSAQTGRPWEAAPGECVHSRGAWRKVSGVGGLEVDLGALWPCGGFGLVSSVALRQCGSGDSRWVFILGRISKIPHTEGEEVKSLTVRCGWRAREETWVAEDDGG